MVKWTIQIDLEVDPMWVRDGFNMSDSWRLEELENHFETDQLPFIYPEELKVKAKVISGPSEQELDEIANSFEDN